MKYIKVLFLLLMVSFSCKKKSDILENRIMYTIKPNSKKIIDNYSLNIISKDSIIDYKYANQNLKKSFRFRYYLDKDVLIGGLGVFFYKDKEIIIDKTSFKIYSEDEGKGFSTHPTFVLFNEEFGFKADLVYGFNSIFSKDSITKEELNITYKSILSST